MITQEDQKATAESEFLSEVRTIAESFECRQNTPGTLVILRGAIASAARNIEASHPMIRIPTVEIVDDRNGRLTIIAPVKHVFELEQERRDEDARRELSERLIREAADRDAVNLRHYKSMLRRLRKLEAKHGGSLPPATTAMWHSLSEWQQYAILKDFDYAARHKA